MTVVATLAQTTLPAGAGNTRTNANIPDTAKVARVTLNKIGWPGIGGSVGSFKISFTRNNGQTWEELMSTGVEDNPADGNVIVFTASIDAVGIGRKLLIDWDLTRAGLTISGAIEAL